MFRVNTITSTDPDGGCDLNQEPALIEAENRFLGVIARLRREDDDHRIRSRLARFGCMVLYPPPLLA